MTIIIMEYGVMHMDKKNIIIAASIAGLIAVCSIFMFCNKFPVKENINQLENNTINKNQQNLSKEEQVIKDKELTNQKNELKLEKTNQKNIKFNESKKIKHTNLYNDLSSSALPLSAITELSDLPDNIKVLVNDISKTGNIYMLQKHHDKLTVISDNTDNIRHGIEFTEISIKNGHQTKTTLGYNDKMTDSQNDIWEYVQETGLPQRHTKYNSEGDMDFVEVWNYDSNNPVKYEMKDAAGKVISIRKETLNNGTDLRVENLLYDKDGNTLINVSATYDGDDIKRFTYYNADKIGESGSIFSEYSDGQKIKETVYTSDLKVKNTYTSDYEDGYRKDVIIWDSNNNEVTKYLPNDEL